MSKPRYFEIEDSGRDSVIDDLEEWAKRQPDVCREIPPPAAGPWQPISAAPRDGTMMLACNRFGTAWVVWASGQGFLDGNGEDVGGLLCFALINPPPEEHDAAPTE